MKFSLIDLDQRPVVSPSLERSDYGVDPAETPVPGLEQGAGSGMAVDFLQSQGTPTLGVANRRTRHSGK
jgi:hypothetical protein